MTRPRMSVVASPPERRAGRTGAWLRDAEAQRDGTAIVHLSAVSEDVPRLAGAVWALEETSAFDQLVLDATPGGGADRVLAELGLDVPVRRIALDSTGLREELALGRAAALMLHSGGSAALTGALAAARSGVSVVRVGPMPEGSLCAHAVARLSDLVLVSSADDARTLVPRIGAERIHVVGNPLIDVVRRCSRKAVFRAAWRHHGVEPGRYVLALLSDEPLPELAATLAALTAETPLVIEAPPAWRECLAGAVQAGARVTAELGIVDRLSLEKAAGAIVTTTVRVHEEAAALGIRCLALEDVGTRIGARSGGGPVALDEPCSLIDSLPEVPMPRMVPLWDGHAGTRLADVLVANFARVRLA
jgi:UDP-N-acetylglucosamine 2-epimerase (non-hydrolysing)